MGICSVNEHFLNNVLDGVSSQGVAVNACKELGVKVRGWQWGCHIHMNMPESGVCASESSQWRLCVSCYLRSLTVEAGFDPVSDIRVHVLPHETRANRLQCNSNSGCEGLCIVLKTCRCMPIGTRGLDLLMVRRRVLFRYLLVREDARSCGFRAMTLSPIVPIH